MTESDRYRGVADALVQALQVARGDDAKEEAAIRAAIAGYNALADGDDPVENGMLDYLMEEGSADDPPALERVPGSSDEDQQRWRDKLLDLAGL